jgi:hypothetical protein
MNPEFRVMNHRAALSCLLTVAALGCAGQRFESGADEQAATSEAGASSAAVGDVVPVAPDDTDAAPSPQGVPPSDDAPPSDAPGLTPDQESAPAPSPSGEPAVPAAPDVSNPPVDPSPVDPSPDLPPVTPPNEMMTAPPEAPQAPIVPVADAGAAAEPPAASDPIGLEGGAAPDVDATAPDAGPAPKPPDCAEDEERGPNGHCYFFASEDQEWEDARESCRARGGGWDLAAINSQAEHTWVSSRLDEDSWLGAVNVDDTWVWVNTETVFWDGDDDGEPVNDAFTWWEDTEPSGGNDSGQCLRYSDAAGDWFWADMPCTADFAHVCERTD